MENKHDELNMHWTVTLTFIISLLLQQNICEQRLLYGITDYILCGNIAQTTMT